jgi:hypothetical protein
MTIDDLRLTNEEMRFNVQGSPFKVFKLTPTPTRTTKNSSAFKVNGIAES